MDGYSNDSVEFFSCSESSDSEEEDLLEQQSELDANLMQDAQTALLSAEYVGMIDVAPARAPRRWQKKHHTNDFYVEMEEAWPRYGVVEVDKEYILHFRVDKQTFNMLHSQIKARLVFPAMSAMAEPSVADLTAMVQDVIQKCDRYRSDVLHSRRRFAVLMYWLANGGHYRHTADNFGIARSTVCVILKEVIAALDDALFEASIRWPSEQELPQVMADMELLKVCDLPLCAGAIDGSFIHMPEPPGASAEKYWCYKDGHAIILLAVVDAAGIFTFIYVGQPATVGDAASFRRSSLRKAIVDNKALPKV